MRTTNCGDTEQTISEASWGEFWYYVLNEAREMRERIALKYPNHVKILRLRQQRRHTALKHPKREDMK